MHRYIPLLLSLTLIQVAAAQPSDKWIGRFINRESGVRLEVKDRQNGIYTGAFTYNGTTMAIRCTESIGNLVGEYAYQSKWFPFTIAIEQGKYRLSADGVTLGLERDNGAGPSTKDSPKPLPQPDAQGKVNAAWTQRLKGRQLLFLQTAGGGTTKATVNLFADGRFTFETSSSYLSGGSSDFSYASQDSDHGTWKIMDTAGATYLFLRSAKSGTSTQSVLKQGATAGQLQLDGRRFFIQNLPQ